jgi:hypothetical protein
METGMSELEFEGTVDSFTDGVFTVIVAGRENVTGRFISGCKVPPLEKGVRIKVRGNWIVKLTPTDEDSFGATGYTITG